MTEAYEDGNYLVRVRAQVMTRDDSSGGWVPLGGGGLSNVSVRKRHPSSTAPHSRHASVDGPDAGGGGGGGVNNAPSSQAPQPKHEYLIYGKRISDQSIVLSCIIKKDFEYNKVMPTFHHWKTGDKKFGLTFQTAADARAFDKGVRTAVEELLDGLTDTFPLSSIHKYPKDVADDDVFMTLNLPIEAPPTESRMSGGDVSSGGGTMGTSPHQTRDMHKIHYIQCQDRDLSPPVTKEQQKADNYSYVQLTAVHDYNYPVVDDTKGSVCRQDVVVGSKKRSLDVIGTTQTSMPACKDAQKKTQNKYVRARCRHCNKLFSEDSNGCGSCEYAPDCVRRGIDAVTCISCAQGMLYHCMADAEGDFALHPCECAPPAAGDDGCCKRWAGLTLLSVLVPCLWCYLPLRACHSCGVACGVCGGKHAAC